MLGFTPHGMCWRSTEIMKSYNSPALNIVCSRKETDSRSSKQFYVFRAQCINNITSLLDDVPKMETILESEKQSFSSSLCLFQATEEDNLLLHQNRWLPSSADVSLLSPGIVNRGDSFRRRRSRSGSLVGTGAGTPPPATTAPAACHRVAMVGAPGVGKTALISQFQTSECINAVSCGTHIETSSKLTLR
ncbi:unnamed protein product [Leptidea sinapis]|uniref:Uncharacterized protein n=1 Tax=Leptidea sinapis TaxID=189913 RepID=A0A5E4QC17_9NEOP|nr:unnamed protein product [Leptidea sinapis]